MKGAGFLKNESGLSARLAEERIDKPSFFPYNKAGALKKVRRAGMERTKSRSLFK